MPRPVINVATGDPAGPEPQPGHTGISTTTLAVGITIPIVVLLGLSILIVYIGTRKGWFMPKGHKENQYRGLRGGAGSTEMSHRCDHSGCAEEHELDGHHYPHRIEGREIYQLPADERVQR
jgi:hypothetical protein